MGSIRDAARGDEYNDCLDSYCGLFIAPARRRSQSYVKLADVGGDWHRGVRQWLGVIARSMRPTLHPLCRHPNFGCHDV